MKSLIKKVGVGLFYRLYKALRISKLKEMENNEKLIMDISKMKFSGKNLNINPLYYFINPQYLTIGNDFYCLHNLRLEAYDKYGNTTYFPDLVIGNNVRFGSDCHVGCINSVHIMDNVLIASKVFITDHVHGQINKETIKQTPLDRDLYSPGPVVIENNVWIGENVVIMPNVTIGANSVIGANAVVTKNIPKNSVVAGVPARVLREI